MNHDNFLILKKQKYRRLGSYILHYGMNLSPRAATKFCSTKKNNARGEAQASDPCQSGDPTGRILGVRPRERLNRRIRCWITPPERGLSWKLQQHPYKFTSTSLGRLAYIISSKSQIASINSRMEYSVSVPSIKCLVWLAQDQMLTVFSS
ncbi:hypothetical protein L211DRAFT_401583 [Terfezia boudieri ATCC MYA-4762]|uniref:Uncharacterized protein n=1 Tax=Terfezia boudieri ATCC MYA-4762 TaxID=1051890 RepID=A0A3N4MJW5_9PEZI|nr:hypothetical protein L211DRAFT_401583 [Terfezia boudieri ATCC MYA-4762]